MGVVRTRTPRQNAPHCARLAILSTLDAERYDCTPGVAAGVLRKERKVHRRCLTPPGGKSILLARRQTQQPNG
jgi:hypothetical protein